MKLVPLAVIVAAVLAGACAPAMGRAGVTDADSSQFRLHVIAQGETYQSIAGRYQVDPGALLEANGRTTTTPLNPGQPLVIPLSHAAVPTGTAGAGQSTTDPAASSLPFMPPQPRSREWRDAQMQRARAAIDDIRAREGGIFFLAGAGLVGGFIALQVLFWLARELVLTIAFLLRKLGAIGHEIGLNVWYAAWWAGLALWIPVRAIWRLVGPVLGPRLRALGRFALNHGTASSRAAARRAQALGRRAAIAVRDEAIDALEELALRRPSLRGVSAKVQQMAYRESRATRSRLPLAATEAWPPSEQALLDALQRGALSVGFAPVFDIAGDGTVAIEATHRWERPGAGSVPGARLAMAVERPGYTRIQRALLEHTLREAAARIAVEPRGATLPTVMVPLGRAQLLDPTLFGIVRAAVGEADIFPSQLDLGVDERAVLADPVAASEVLARLRELGVATHLREFGALTPEQIDRLPVLGVTIDFWNSRHDKRIEAYVAESVRTARAAGLPVTALRAETPDEIEFARSLGCERLTGTLPEFAVDAGSSGDQDETSLPDFDDDVPPSPAA
jgi:EAL domain-containing protein (putative c-di-GMP-specific phosphodiesterase class I)